MNCGALIVETRERIDLPRIIDQHMEKLPADWGLAVFTNELNAEHIKRNYPAAKVFAISGRNFGIYEYNNLLTSNEFWEIVPFDKALIFQHDSRILRKGIEEFLEWDYIGAPWPFQYRGGNGGLSLRSKDVMLKIIKQLPYSQRHHGNEDVYFSNRVEDVGGKLAPREACEKFSCETIFKLGTFGCHAIEKYMNAYQVNQILSQYDNRTEIQPALQNAK